MCTPLGVTTLGVTVFEGLTSISQSIWSDFNVQHDN